MYSDFDVGRANEIVHMQQLIHLAQTKCLREFYAASHWAIYSEDLVGVPFLSSWRQWPIWIPPDTNQYRRYYMTSDSDKNKAICILKVAICLAKMFGMERPALLYQGPNIKVPHTRMLSGCTNLLDQVEKHPTSTIAELDKLGRLLSSGAYSNMTRGPVNTVRELLFDTARIADVEVPTGNEPVLSVTGSRPHRGEANHIE